MIPVDTTAVSEDGLLRVRRDRFTGDLPRPGTRLNIIDAVNELAGNALMVRSSESGRFVYLDVDWASVRDGVNSTEGIAGAP